MVAVPLGSNETTMRSDALLPDAQSLASECVLFRAGWIALVLSSVTTRSQRPQCRRKSFRVHSHYRRWLDDLPSPAVRSRTSTPLLHWERMVADTRIHGTRRQVLEVFEQQEREAPGSLPRDLEARGSQDHLGPPRDLVEQDVAADS